MLASLLIYMGCIQHDSTQFPSSLSVSMWTWRHSGLRTQEAPFLPLCSVFHFEKLSEGGRVRHCSCNAFPVSGESPRAVSADPQPSKLPSSAHTSTSWAVLIWRAVFLAQAILVTDRAKEVLSKNGCWASALQISAIRYCTRSGHQSCRCSSSARCKTTHWGSNTAHKVQRCRGQLCSAPIPV